MMDENVDWLCKFMASMIGGLIERVCHKVVIGKIKGE